MDFKQIREFLYRESIVLSVIAAVLAILLVVLQEAAKLKGHVLLWLLLLCAVLTIPIAVFNPWVVDALGKWKKLLRGALILVIIVCVYGSLGYWILNPESEGTKGTQLPQTAIQTISQSLSMPAGNLMITIA